MFELYKNITRTPTLEHRYGGEMGRHNLNELIWYPKIGPIWQQRLTWCKDIVSAIHFLHHRDICHGNLRSSNIFTTSKYLLTQSNHDEGTDKKRKQSRRETILSLMTSDSVLHQYSVPQDDDDDDWTFDESLSHATLGDPYFVDLIHHSARLDDVRMRQLDHPTGYLWYAPELLIAKQRVLDNQHRLNALKSSTRLDRLGRSETLDDSSDPQDIAEPQESEDIYALGMLIHEITELRSPFDYSKKIRTESTGSSGDIVRKSLRKSTRIKTSVPEKNNLSTRLSSKLLFARNKFSDDEIQNRIESDVLNGMRPNQVKYKTRTSERTDMYRIEGDYENEIVKCLRKITKKCWRQDPTARPKVGYVLSMLNRIIAGVHVKSRRRRGK